MNETRKSRQGKKRILKTVLSVLMIAMVGVIAYMFKAYSDIGSTAESIYNEVSVVEMREESIEVETATQPISFVLLGLIPVPLRRNVQKRDGATQSSSAPSIQTQKRRLC